MNRPAEVQTRVDRRLYSTDFARVTERLGMLRRAGDVVRLHAWCRTVHTRRISEHVYGAQCIAAELAWANMRNPGPAVVLLLYHDAPEVETGDVPAPVKRSDPRLKDMYELLELKFCDRWDLNEPDAKHLRVQNIPGPVSDEMDHAIAKAADILDLAWMCLDEYRLGNRQPAMRIVFSNALSYAQEFSWVSGVNQIVEFLTNEWNIS